MLICWFLLNNCWCHLRFDKFQMWYGRYFIMRSSIHVMKLVQFVNKLDSFHIKINGYQIDVGTWLILLINRNYYWCKYTCYGYEITTWVVDRHCCCAKTTSSNCWACSWLPPLWIFTTCGWVDAYVVIWWVIEGAIGSLYTTNLVAVWCLLVFTFHATSMFGAFTSLFPIGCIYYSFCICANFDIGWCIT